MKLDLCIGLGHIQSRRDSVIKARRLNAGSACPVRWGTPANTGAASAALAGNIPALVAIALAPALGALPDSRRRAFTVVELLVVVAIIVILAGLLLPALSRGRAAALATECRNNLRTLGLGMQMYRVDFNAYPPTTGSGIMGYGEQYGWLMMNDWKAKLVPFIGVSERFPDRQDTMRVLRCPQKVSNEDGKRGEGQFAMNASGTARFESGFDLGIGGFGEGWRRRPTWESVVRTPADLIAVGDITPGRTMGEMFITSGRFDPCSTDPALWPGTSHAGGANLLFADGHVESGRQTNWLSLTHRHRWNNDGQPHPETWGRE